MAVRVRLFAALREAAGTGATEVEPGRLSEVLDALRDRYGPRFVEVLAISTVLLNGDPVRAARDVDVPDDAELALLPPVSGGSDALTPAPVVTSAGLAAVGLLAVGAVGAVLGGWAWTAAVVVAAVAALVDLVPLLARGVARPVVPALLLPGIVLPLVVARAPATAWETVASWLALTVLVAFALVIVFGRRGGVTGGIAATGIAGLVVGLGVAGLLALRALEQGPAAVLALGLAGVAADVARGICLRAGTARSTVVGIATGAVGLVALVGGLTALDWVVAIVVAGVALGASFLGEVLTRTVRPAAAPVGGALLAAVDTVFLAAPAAAVVLRAVG